MDLNSRSIPSPSLVTSGTLIRRAASEKACLVAERQAAAFLEPLEPRTHLAAQLTIGDIQVNESAGQATFTIRMDAPRANPYNVNYSAHGGTAKIGKDFRRAVGVATFAANQTSVNVTVPLINDNVHEDNEVLYLRTSVVGESKKAVAQALVIDDDPVPTLAVTYLDPTQNIKKTQTGSSQFVDEPKTPVAGKTKTIAVDVYLRNASRGTATATTAPVTVNYSTADVTATAGTDYLAASGTLTFKPGQTHQRFLIRILSDAIAEPTETFNVVLSNASSNATLPAAATVVKIQANDSAGRRVTTA